MTTTHLRLILVTISVTGIKIVASYYHNGSADLWTLCGICDSNTSGDIQGQR